MRSHAVACRADKAAEQSPCVSGVHDPEHIELAPDVCLAMLPTLVIVVGSTRSHGMALSYGLSLQLTC